MATEIAREWRRDWALPPGEILEEALEERRMTQAELARRMNRPLKTINEIIKGKAAITPGTAFQLELALGISSRFWNNLERNYREHEARVATRAALESAADWADRFPIPTLRRYDLITGGRRKTETLESLLRFFRVTSPSAWQRQWEPMTALYRGAGRRSATLEGISAWLRWGEIAAERISTQPYSPDKFMSALAETRSLARQDITLIFDKLQRLWADAGVVLVGIPELPHAPLSGVARWLYSDRPLVQLSFRYRTDDQIWFSLFHEAAHVLKHNRRLVFLDKDETDVDSLEAEANVFARDSLVPPAAYMELVRIGKFDAETVRSFARTSGVAPGIVVGMLQHDKHLPPSGLKSLKRPVRWTA